jgi:hypothetical protein
MGTQISKILQQVCGIMVTTALVLMFFTTQDLDKGQPDREYRRKTSGRQALGDGRQQLGETGAVGLPGLPRSAKARQDG